MSNTSQNTPDTILSAENLARAHQLVERYGRNATSFQILNPGIHLWFCSEGDGVIGHVHSQNTRVVAGAPVCPEERLLEIVREFEREATALGMNVVYFGVEQRIVDLLGKSAQRACIALGAQPSWDPGSWPDMLAGHASLRQQLNRARNKGTRVGLWSNCTAAAHPELLRVLQEWLATRGLPPLHFLVEPQTLTRLFNRLVFVADIDGQPVGFLVASPVPLRNGWLVEQIVRGHNAPNGTAELLLDAAQTHMAGLGSMYITLGLSPISRRAGLPDTDTPAWLRIVLKATRAWGSRFYNFDGLDAFKAKFRPETWETVYALSSTAHFSVSQLYAASRAFAGSPLLPFVLHSSR